MATSPQRMFWLRDLAVVVAVLAFAGMLISLWVRHRREPPTGGPHCINNLRQVTQAALSKALRKEKFPGYKDDLGGMRAAWPMTIMPELGRMDIYDVMVQTSEVPALQVDVLVCPSDRNRRQSQRPLSYVINAGPAYYSDNPANGIALDYSFRSETQTRQSVKDGLSQTLFFSENLQATQWNLPGKLDTVFLWHPTMTPRPEHRINGGATKSPLTIHTARPSSFHNRGVMMSFCDGHTRFISQDIDYRVYMQLMTPNGEESDMPAPWRDYYLTEADFD